MPEAAAMALQPMDVTSLKAVLAEWPTLLLPSRFEKAQQGDPHTLQVGLRTLQGLQWLELSWQAEAARCHAIPPPPRLGEGSTLAQQIQHGLRGMALVALEQPGWERVVRLGFARRPGESLERELVLELMGRHSNLLLLDAANQQVIAMARQVKPGQSRLRPMGTGDRYQSPPALLGEPPSLNEPLDRWQQRLRLVPLPLGKALRDAYQGISPALTRQLAPLDWLEQPVENLSETQWQSLWRQWRRWLEALAEGQFCWQAEGEGYRCWGGAAADHPGGMALNTALAAYYQGRLQDRRLQQRRQQLAHQLELAESRERQQLEHQQRLLDQVPEREALQRQADALLSQRQPSRTCIDEAQALYHRARKLRRSVAAITPRLEEHQRRLAALEASLTFLEQAETPEQIEALASDCEPLFNRAGRSRNDRRQPGASDAHPQPLELPSPGGVALQVGRNHRQNEWISFRQARRGDLWFHAQELPGSHVVLKGSTGPVTDADLQAAADLAAYFSRGRGNTRVPIVMVPAEELQRIPGSAPGTVRHRGGTVLWGEPLRALTLLAAQPEGPRR